MAHGVLEIPVTGDYTYNLQAYGFANSFKTAIRDFELTRSRDGVFVMNNHPGRFGDRGFRFLRTVLETIEKDTQLLRLVDVAKYATRIEEEHRE
jgi:hypothetical protein